MSAPRMFVAGVRLDLGPRWYGVVREPAARAALRLVDECPHGHRSIAPALACAGRLLRARLARVPGSVVAPSYGPAAPSAGP